MYIDLSKEQILVTGSSRGIGLAITKQLIESGATVLGMSRSFPKTELGDKYSHLAVDFNNLEEVITSFSKIKESLPSLTAVVFNAGIFEEHAIDSEVKDWYKVWNKTMNVNCNSVGVLTHQLVNYFKEAGGGRLIYIGSRAVSRGETPEYLAYGASKGAITSLAKTVARSFGKENIKAFTIAPGFVETDMAASFIKTHGRERVINELALNELTQPSDISPLVALLCSGQMDHATGTTIDLNAGSYIR